MLHFVFILSKKSKNTRTPYHSQGKCRVNNFKVENASAINHETTNRNLSRYFSLSSTLRETNAASSQ